MKWKPTLVVFSAAIFVLAGTLFMRTSRAGYESASYKVVEKSGKFEIRQYPDLPVVTTPMSGGQNSGFGRLFRYISGDNAAEKKIAMTTPVFMPADSQGTTREMQFLVPSDVARAGTPAPKGRSVSLKKMRGGKYAVLRFSGRTSAATQKKRLAELRKELESRGLKATGNPVFAGFDPPWTPAPVRRNEVMLRLR